MNLRSCVGENSACIGAFAMGITILTAASQQSGITSMIPIATLHRIATIDERYQSYNVEMAEVIGGNFWKPYGRGPAAAQSAPAPAPTPSAATGTQTAGQDPSMFQRRPPIDLSNARLRRLAAALGPAYMRTSGTWANMVYLHDADTPAPATAPRGFQGVLTRSEWKGVVDFTHAANAKLVSSFTVSSGVRDASGRWTPDQARRFVAATTSVGGEIAAAEFFNEPDMPSFGGAPAGYTAADYARDFAIFRTFANETAPQMKIVGPGSVGEGTLMPAMQGTGLAAGLVSTASMLSATPKPVFDVFSYHFYGAASLRCASMGSGAQTTADAALSEEWLGRTETSFEFYARLRDRFQPGKPIWITETADAACGGNPWAAWFLDSFRYLDQLGRLAKHGVSVVFHNTLASSEYGLLDQNTFAPRPNYWAALLWHRLMGTTVLDAGPLQPGFHVYAQCLRGQAGGVAVLAINTSRTETRSLEFGKQADRFTLSAKTLDSAEVQLNGQPLRLVGDIPEVRAERVAAGRLTFSPTTITFVAVPDAANSSCR